MLWNCLEEDVCLYRPNARWGGEFEWLKTLQGPQLEIAENSWVSGSENLKINGQTALTSPHVVWEGFKKNDPSSSKNNLQHIQLSDTTGTSNRTGFYRQMKLKMSILAANTQDWFGEHRDKTYPMCTMKYTAVFLMLWAYISAGGPGHLV